MRGHICMAIYVSLFLGSLFHSIDLWVCIMPILYHLTPSWASIWLFPHLLAHECGFPIWHLGFQRVLLFPKLLRELCSQAGTVLSLRGISESDVQTVNCSLYYQHLTARTLRKKVRRILRWQWWKIFSKVCVMLNILLGKGGNA